MATPLDASFRDRRGEDRAQLGATLNEHIWGLPQLASSKFHLEHYDALSSGVDINKLFFQTHRDAVGLVTLVKNGRHRALHDLKNDIRALRPIWLLDDTDATIQEAIDYAVKLWLMVETRSWNGSDSLCTYVQGLFVENPGAVPADEEIRFNARSLWAIGGFDIRWTSWLSEHLRVKGKTLYVFSYASILHTRRIGFGHSQAYPQRLLLETAETIALLFPPSPTSHRGWRRRIKDIADVDVETGVAASTPEHLTEYFYWRDRLKVIQDTYDSTAPTKLRQWVHDRRDGNRFWIFWLTVAAVILGLLFGLVQSATGLYSAIHG